MDLKTKDDYVKRYDRVFRWSDEDNAYLVLFPELPGCVSHGDSLEEAFENGDLAAMAYLSICDDLEKPYPMPATISKEIRSFALRLEAPLYQLLKVLAEETGISMNETIVQRLSGADVQLTPEEKLHKAIFGKAPERKARKSKRPHGKKPQAGTRKHA